MSFLVLLLAVWIEKFSALRHRIQRDGGWVRELHKLESSPRLINHPWWVLVILVLLPVALLGLLLVVLEPVAYGLLALPVHLLVVIYSLGRGDLQGGLGPFRDAWRREDLQAAAHVAKRDLDICADSGEQLLERVQGHLLWQAYQSFFAVIFWYFLLGPVAALSYRLLALAETHGKNPAVVECAITGAPDEVRGSVVKATIILGAGYEPSSALVKDIQTFVKHRTAPYKYPRIIEFVDTMPKTVSGKIRRVVLREESQRATDGE